jgi:hypothetical protein
MIKYFMPQNMKQNNLQKAVTQLKDGANPYLTMYFVFKGAEPIIKLVDIDKVIRDDFASKFKDFLIEKFYEKENIVVGKLSEADERNYDALLFDLETPNILKELLELIKKPDRDKYSHKKDKDLKLDGYIFILGNDKVKVSFYKEHYSVDLITRDSYVMFGRSDSRFIPVTDEIFKITNTIDFIQISDELYVLNLKVLESNFKIHDVIKKEAENFILEINKKAFVENPQFITDIINENPAFARKVLRVNRNSPVLKLPFDDIKKFIAGHPHLTGKLKFNKKGNKIELDTKVSANLFVKLMDDDFLKSELTKELYDSITKDRIELEAQKEKKAKKKDK